MQIHAFKRLQLSGWRQFQEVDIELHPVLTVITGANGAGKSTILTFFNRHFGYNRNFLATPRERNKDGNVLFSYARFKAFVKSFSPDKPEPPSKDTIGSIEYASGVISALLLPSGQGLHYNISIANQQGVAGIHVDSHRPPSIYREVTNFPSAPPVMGTVGTSLNAEFMHYYTHGQIQNGGLHHIKMTLIQMSIFGHGNSVMEKNQYLLDAFAEFEEKLRILLPESLGFQGLKIRSPEVLLSTSSGDFIIDAASGGVIKLIEVAWQLYFFSKINTSFVITFDEPENHLHPSMQKAFLPNIIAAFPQAQIIVATHSPFIISAMQDSHVYVLRYVDTDVESIDGDKKQPSTLKDMRVVAERLDTVNKAGSASEILRDVLGITTTIPDWAERRIGEIVHEYKGVPLDDQAFRSLYGKLESEGLASSYPSAVASLTRPQ